MVEEESTLLGHEDRLKAIAYSFMQVYDHFTEQRLENGKHNADMADMLKNFKKHIDDLMLFVPTLRRELLVAAEKEIERSCLKVGKEVSKAAAEASEETNRSFSITVDNAARALRAYQQEVVETHWKVLGFGFLGMVLTGFLVFKFVMPTPTLPLTTDQISAMNTGYALNFVWSKLSKKEQDRINKLFNDAAHPNSGANEQEQNPQ